MASSIREASATAENRIVPIATAAVATVIFLIVLNRFPLDQDAGWFMSVARRLLGGERLYRDIIEVNPPLVVYLVMPAVVLADLTGMSDAVSLKLLVLAVASCSILWFMRLVGPGRARSATVGWVVLLGFATLIVPAADFGQREHLLLLLTLPFLAVKWRRLSDLAIPAAEAYTAGGVAAVGFALKPHFLLIWLGLEALDWTKAAEPWKLRLRPESVSAAGVFTLYPLYVVAAHPAYLSLMAELTPLYYASSGVGFRLLFTVYFGLPLLIVLLAWFVSRGAVRNHHLSVVFLTYACAGLLVAFSQGKGWRYHSLPMIVATVVAWGILVRDVGGSKLTEVRRPRALRTMLGAVLLVLAVYPFYHAFVRALSVADEQRSETLRRARRLAIFGPEKILVFGDKNFDTYPLVNHLGARSVSPHPSLWWLTATYGSREPALDEKGSGGSSDVERRLSRLLVDSFVRDTPDLVLVDTAAGSEAGSTAFPYVEYFSQDSAFAEAWKNYSRAGAVGDFAIWRHGVPSDSGVVRR